jgi:hypothetical protein
MSARRRQGALLFGASLLLHLGALLLLLDLPAPGRKGDPGASPALQVTWIRMPEVAPPPASAQPAVATRPRLAERRARARDEARVSARISTTAEPLPAPGVEPASADSAPLFDREAALRSARKLAGEPDPARAGTVGAQLDARRVLRETEDEKLGRTIASAKRSACLKANGGGSLLTPLMWLLDKKDSGCKW